MSLPTYARNRKRLWSAGGAELGRRSLDGGSTWTTFYAPAALCSEGIRDWTHKGPPYRAGGPMFLERNIVTYSPSAPVNITKTGFPSVRYKGVMIPDTLPGDPVLPSFDLSAYGAIGISRTIPVAPTASLGLFLAELRDAPRMVKQAKDALWALKERKVRVEGLSFGRSLRLAKKPREIGDNYLGVVFGWLPFLRDIGAALETATNVDKTIRHLKRNFGKPVVRARRLKKESYSTFISESRGSPLLVTTYPTLVYSQAYTNDSPNGVKTQVEDTEINMWFKATYRYYSPEVAAADDLKLRRGLYGLSLDAELLYNAIPWTWLLDWFTNTGALVRNAVLLSRHHVVIDHGYVMCHVRKKRTLRCKNILNGGSNTVKLAVPVECSAVRLKETKQRVTANPYGFGITWDSFTAYQFSILAALGVTRRSHSAQ